MEFTYNKAAEVADQGMAIQGLVNPGALCYAISIIQLIYQVPLIQQSILTTDMADQAVMSALKNVFSFISGTQIEIPPSNVLVADLLSAMYPGKSVDLMQQKDATEFFIDLISSFSFLPVEKNPFVASLRGELQHVMQATESVQFCKQFGEKFFFLSVDVHNIRDLKASLQQFVRPVSFQYRWQTGQPAENTTKQVHILQPPLHLLLNLNRFKFDPQNKRKMKLNSFFSFPRRLDLTPYLAEKDLVGKKCVYRLSAVVIHKGASAYAGHYYTLARVRRAETEEEEDILEENWVKMDDDRLSDYDVDMLATDAFGSMLNDGDEDEASGSDEEDESGFVIQSAKLLLYDLER